MFLPLAYAAIVPGNQDLDVRSFEVDDFQQIYTREPTFALDDKPELSFRSIPEAPLDPQNLAWENNVELTALESRNLFIRSWESAIVDGAKDMFEMGKSAVKKIGSKGLKGADKDVAHAAEKGTAHHAAEAEGKHAAEHGTEKKEAAEKEGKKGKKGKKREAGEKKKLPGTVLCALCQGVD